MKTYKELLKENETLKQENQGLKVLLSVNFVTSSFINIVEQAEKKMIKNDEVLIKIDNKLYTEKETIANSISTEDKIKELENEVRCLREGNRVLKILKYQDIRKAVEKARARQLLKDLKFLTE